MICRRELTGRLEFASKWTAKNPEKDDLCAKSDVARDRRACLQVKYRVYKMLRLERLDAPPDSRGENLAYETRFIRLEI